MSVTNGSVADEGVLLAAGLTTSNTGEGEGQLTAAPIANSADKGQSQQISALSTTNNNNESLGALATTPTNNLTVVDHNPDTIAVATASNMAPAIPVMAPVLAPRPRPYQSRLDWMRRRWISEEQPLERFWGWWNKIYEETIPMIPVYQRVFTDYVTYKAERRCFERLWPHEYFPGDDPSLGYERQIYDMYERAVYRDQSYLISEWKEVFDKSSKMIFRGGGLSREMDIYCQEKWIWEQLWPMQPFPGKDPEEFPVPKLELPQLEEVLRQRRRERRRLEGYEEYSSSGEETDEENAQTAAGNEIDSEHISAIQDGQGGAVIVESSAPPARNIRAPRPKSALAALVDPKFKSGLTQDNEETLEVYETTEDEGGQDEDVDDNNESDNNEYEEVEGEERGAFILRRFGAAMKRSSLRPTTFLTSKNPHIADKLYRLGKTVEGTALLQELFALLPPSHHPETIEEEEDTIEAVPELAREDSIEVVPELAAKESVEAGPIVPVPKRRGRPPKNRDNSDFIPASTVKRRPAPKKYLSLKDKLAKKGKSFKIVAAKSRASGGKTKGPTDATSTPSLTKAVLNDSFQTTARPTQGMMGLTQDYRAMASETSAIGSGFPALGNYPHSNDSRHNQFIPLQQGIMGPPTGKTATASSSGRYRGPSSSSDDFNWALQGWVPPARGSMNSPSQVPAIVNARVTLPNQNLGHVTSSGLPGAYPVPSGQITSARGNTTTGASNQFGGMVHQSPVDWSNTISSQSQLEAHQRNQEQAKQSAQQPSQPPYQLGYNTPGRGQNIAFYQSGDFAQGPASISGEVEYQAYLAAAETSSQARILAAAAMSPGKATQPHVRPSLARTTVNDARIGQNSRISLSQPKGYPASPQGAVGPQLHAHNHMIAQMASAPLSQPQSTPVTLRIDTPAKSPNSTGSTHWSGGKINLQRELPPPPMSPTQIGEDIEPQDASTGRPKPPESPHVHFSLPSDSQPSTRAHAPAVNDTAPREEVQSSTPSSWATDQLARFSPGGTTINRSASKLPAALQASINNEDNSLDELDLGLSDDLPGMGGMGWKGGKEKGKGERGGKQSLGEIQAANGKKAKNTKNTASAKSAVSTKKAVGSKLTPVAQLIADFKSGKPTNVPNQKEHTQSRRTRSSSQAHASSSPNVDREDTITGVGKKRARVTGGASDGDKDEVAAPTRKRGRPRKSKN